jgi:Curli production assembly/transport component CsgG
VSRARRRGTAAAFVCLFVGLALAGAERAGGAEAITLAVLDFDSTGAPALGKDGGVLLAELLAAALSNRAGIRLVERAVLRRVMEEQALALSGMVDGASAARVRQLVGSQVLVTGRVFAVSNRLVVTARVISAEAGHLEALAVDGGPGEDPRALAGRMAEEIGRRLSARTEAFVPRSPPAREPSADLLSGIAGMALPRVAVRVRETVLEIEGQHSVAASELTSLLLEASFEVRQVGDAAVPVEPDEYLTRSEAPVGVDVVVLGKAVGQFGLRTGDLVSAKARVKLTAVDTRARRVLAVAEAEAREIDLVPREAALQAISHATREVARDFVPRLVQAWNRKQ